MKTNEPRRLKLGSIFDSRSSIQNYIPTYSWLKSGNLLITLTGVLRIFASVALRGRQRCIMSREIYFMKFSFSLVSIAAKQGIINLSLSSIQRASVRKITLILTNHCPLSCSEFLQHTIFNLGMILIR